MFTVQKFSLGPPSELLVQYEATIPRGALVQSVGMQDGMIVVWALVETDAAEVTRRFVIVGTGQEIAVPAGASIGTVCDRSYVWHVFHAQE